MLGGGLHLPGLINHFVMQTDALGVMAQHDAFHRKPRVDLGFRKMANVGFHRIDRAARAAIGVVHADMAQESVGRIAENLKVTEFGHMAVVIQPFARHTRFMQHHGRAIVRFSSARDGFRTLEEAVFHLAKGLARAPVVGPQSL